MCNCRSSPLTSQSEMATAAHAPTTTKPERAAMPSAVAARSFNFAPDLRSLIGHRFLSWFLSWRRSPGTLAAGLLRCTTPLPQ